MPAPTVGEVLPAFVEFAGDSVVVGPNVRFDPSFLQAAAVASSTISAPSTSAPLTT